MGPFAPHNTRSLWELISNCTHICSTKELFPSYLCNHVRPHSKATPHEKQHLDSTTSWKIQFQDFVKTISTTLTPHIRKDVPLKYAIRKGSHGVKFAVNIPCPSAKERDFHRLLWHTNPDFHDIRTPILMPYDPISLGMGVVFNTLISGFTM